MKRRIAAVFMAAALLLCACGGQQVKAPENMVREAALTERERALISVAADKFVAVDFEVEPAYAQISIWVEKYVFGERQDDALGTVQCMIEGKGTVLYTQGKPGETGLRESQLAVLGEQGNSNVSIPPAKIGADGVAAMWGTSVKEDAFAEELVLGEICYSSANEIRSLTTDFYADPAAHMDELKPYDEVYLLRCRFLKG